MLRGRVDVRVPVAEDDGWYGHRIRTHDAEARLAEFRRTHGAKIYSGKLPANGTTLLVITHDDTVAYRPPVTARHRGRG